MGPAEDGEGDNGQGEFDPLPATEIPNDVDCVFRWVRRAERLIPGLEVRQWYRPFEAVLGGGHEDWTPPGYVAGQEREVIEVDPPVLKDYVHAGADPDNWILPEGVVITAGPPLEYRRKYAWELKSDGLDLREMLAELIRNRADSVARRCAYIPRGADDEMPDAMFRHFDVVRGQGIPQSPIVAEGQPEGYLPFLSPYRLKNIPLPPGAGGLYRFTGSLLTARLVSELQRYVDVN